MRQRAYAFALYNPDASFKGGLGINAILRGNYALEFSDGDFIEPQHDIRTVQPGNWNMSIPGAMYIHSSHYFPNDAANSDMLEGDLLIIFKYIVKEIFLTIQILQTKI